jgi:HPt (histidine-containing phosphotransfer) domain-containing protein
MTGIAERRPRHQAESSETLARLVGFFQSEARAGCDRLLVLLGAEPTPSAGQLSEAVARARVVRGSAAMADQEGIAAVAGRIERILKSLHARRLAWTPALASLLRTAASDLLDLVEVAHGWNESVAERAARVAEELARYDVAERRSDADVVVPIARLFHDDGGPHILFVPVTPQTEFEQQLRALSARGASGGIIPTPPATRPAPSPAATPPGRARAHEPRASKVPTAPRGHELHALLGQSVSRMSAAFDDADDELVPIEDLLYSGRSALERARVLAATIHSRGPENSRELIPELVDLLDLATRN